MDSLGPFVVFFTDRYWADKFDHTHRATFCGGFLYIDREGETWATPVPVIAYPATLIAKVEWS